MTRDEAKELLPIIQAHAEGRAIQMQCDDGWYDTVDPQFVGNKYRIKPVPREWVLYTTQEGGMLHVCSQAPEGCHSVIRVREVIPE